MSFSEKMTAIADNIRSKTGKTEPLTLEDMANGVNDVYEAGKTSEQREFWKVLAGNGAKRTYSYTFSENNWTKDNFKPTCNIVPTEADHTFYRHNYGETAYDMAQQLEDLGVVLDLSNCTLGNYTFENAVVSRLPELNMEKGTFTCFVRNCKSLVTIDKIICSSEGNQNFTQTFNACTSLKNIVFEGTIGKNISFLNSPLTVNSLKSIISCLKDYSAESPFTCTLTLKDSCKMSLEADTETVEFNGESYTYFELITAKGWNLA